jgi:hypothetical protein
MAGKKERVRRTSPIGIACFVHVFSPEAPREGAKNKDPKYKMMLVFDAETWKNAPEVKELKLACVAAAEEKFGKDAREKIKKGKIKMPWRPASDYGDEGYGFPFDQEGAYMISFSSKEAPGVVDRKAKPLMKQSEFYSGCFARATYGVWPYDTDGNKGVTLFDAVEGEDGEDDGDDDI